MRNVLPPKISLLPSQVERLDAYNYSDTNPLALSDASNRITEEEFRKLRGPSFEHNRHLQRAQNTPQRNGYSTQLQGEQTPPPPPPLSAPPPQQYVYTLSPETPPPPPPAPAVVYRPQTQPTFEPAPVYSTTTVRQPQPPVSAPQYIQYQPQQPAYQTATYYSPRTLELAPKSSATYRINGVEYTEATLPAEFRHLLRK